MIKKTKQQNFKRKYCSEAVSKVEVCGDVENVAIFSGCNISSILLRCQSFGSGTVR
jgi:hypothetical protein